MINDNDVDIAPHEAATFKAIGIRATICMPLVKNGKLTALMAIHDRAPRRWTDRELSLLLAVTERSWSHIERVGVVAELAELNRNLEAVVADRTAERVIDLRGPSRGVQVHEVIWGSRFQVHHKLADRFRDGPFLLVGDAAHVHSPAGGQGMNLGLRDAEALASALVGFLQNGGTQLDDYARKRRRSAQQVLDRTDRLTKLATLKSPASRWLRDRALTLAGRSPAIPKRIAQMLAGYA